MRPLRKSLPFPVNQKSTSTFHVCLFLVFAVCAFPYILAFTTDSIEIRLVVNGNLVYTAVVPELQLVSSRVSVTPTSSFCRALQALHLVVRSVRKYKCEST